MACIFRAASLWVHRPRGVLHPVDLGGAVGNWWRTLHPALYGLGLGVEIERLVRLGTPALPALARLGCVFLTLVSMLLLLLFFIAATRHCEGPCVVDEATAGVDPSVGAGLLPSGLPAFYSTLLFLGFVGSTQSGRD